METEEKKAVSKKVYISTIVALLLINSVTLFLLFSEKGEHRTVVDQKTALQQQFKSLSDTLDSKRVELDQFRGRTAELDKAITEKQEEIDREKKQIHNLLAKGNLTNAELAKAKQMIAQYETSIADLGKKVEELTQQNQALTAQNTGLSNDLTMEKESTSKLTATNQGLSKKVEIGSLLQIPNLQVEAIKTKGNGKEVDVKRAKVAQSLKISFETGQNKVLDPGPLSLYVRIINPKGETIMIEDKGSGTLKSADGAEAVPYTKKADFDYDQTSKKVVVYWGDHIQDPGTYKVEIYQGGQMISQGAVTLS